MGDIINDYFKRFYPADWRTAEYNYSSMLGGMNEYPRTKGSEVNTIFPAMECADGFTLSVQGHFGAYSGPRDDFADHYSSVECGYPSARIEELMPYIDGGQDADPSQSVYGYVPVEVVVEIIKKHGGLKA